MFKTLTAIIQTPHDVDAVLAGVVPLAKRWGAHVVGVHAEALPVAYTSAIGFPDVAIIEEVSKANEERASGVAAAFAAGIGEAGLQSEFHSLRSFSGDAGLAGAAVSRCGDLVVAAQSDPSGESADAGQIDSALYESGRPLLILPRAYDTSNGFRNIVISWNGSREAARAAFDALPLLKEADAVQIVVVDPPEDAEPADVGATMLAATLLRHGVRVTSRVVPSDGRAVEDVVSEAASAFSADLLVMGAYSHSWLRQFLFGGVTRTMIESTALPVFMAR
jgi:nucleotide-binding universal stress UspA family protein